jgi:hypothetical protein
VGDSPTTINANSVLEMESTNKGMLLPRLGLSATNLASPLSAHVSGMVVYNTATAGSGTTAVNPGYYYNDGTKWVKLAGMGDIQLTQTALTSSTAPAGTTVGQMIYNTSAASGLPVGPAYWDGAKWVSAAPGSTSTVTLTSPTAPAGTAAGQVAYNTGSVEPKGLIYWDGTQWKAVNSANSIALTSATAPAGASVGQTMYNTSAVEPKGLVYWDGAKWVAVGTPSSVALTSSTAPAGTTVGQMIYNTSAASGLPVGPAYWDGTKWVSAAPGSTSTVTLTSPTAPAGTAAGQVAYNTGSVEPKGLIYWDGTQWKAVNSANSIALTSATAPAGASVGQTMYNTSSVQPTGMVYWDGTQWKSVNGAAPVALTSSTAPAGAAIGEMKYNTSAASGVPVGPVYWDGTNWQPVGASGEPWFNVATGKGATANTQNIYQLANVGIGTNTPATRLHVVATTDPLRLGGLQATTTSDTLLASDGTGVVKYRSISSVTSSSNIVVKTAAYTATANDYTILCNTTAAGFTLTLPAASTNTGRVYIIRKTDETNNVLTFSPAIKYSETTNFTTLNYLGTIRIQSDGTNWVKID